jgi:hypothetical protein
MSEWRKPFSVRKSPQQEMRKKLLAIVGLVVNGCLLPIFCSRRPMDKNKLIQLHMLRWQISFDAHLKMASLYMKISSCQRTSSANRFSLVSTHDNFCWTVTLGTEECAYM